MSKLLFGVENNEYDGPVAVVTVDVAVVVDGAETDVVHVVVGMVIGGSVFITREDR